MADSRNRAGGVQLTGPAHALVPAVGAGDPTDRDWRQEVKTASGCNVLAGLWLVVSPFVLGYQGADTAWNPVVFGAVIAVFALARIVKPSLRTVWFSAVNALIGAWLFASGFWLATSGEAVWNVWIAGLVVFFLAIWSASTSRSRYNA